jgi:MFS family permease
VTSYVAHSFLFASLSIATIANLIHKRGRALLAGAICLGLVLIVFAYAPSMWLAVPLLVLVGFCNTFYLMQVSTYLQQHVPDHLRGRVMSIYSLCWNLLPLGGLLAGALAAMVNARFAVAVGGGVVAANAALLMTSRRLRAIR